MPLSRDLRPRGGITIMVTRVGSRMLNVVHSGRMSRVLSSGVRSALVIAVAILFVSASQPALAVGWHFVSYGSKTEAANNRCRNAATWINMQPAVLGITNGDSVTV